MQHKALSIQPFTGAYNFELSGNYYSDPGFKEMILSPEMSLFRTGELGFYLLDAYIKDSVDELMILPEVADIERHLKDSFVR